MSIAMAFGAGVGISTRSKAESGGCRFGSSCSTIGAPGSRAPLAPAAPISMPGSIGPSITGEPPEGVPPRLGLGMPSEGEPTPVFGRAPSLLCEPLLGEAALGEPLPAPLPDEASWHAWTVNRPRQDKTACFARSRARYGANRMDMAGELPFLACGLPPPCLRDG